MKVERKIKVWDPHGIHLRAAARLALLLREYQSKVWVRKGMEYFNARSVLCLLQLGAVFGVELTFLSDGDDAAQALEAIRHFLEQGGL